MALTKQDLKAIKDIAVEVSSTQTEELAIIVGNSFNYVQKDLEGIHKDIDSIHKKLIEHDKRFDSNDASHRTINARLDLIETDLSNLRNLVYEVKEIRRLLENAPTKDELSRVDKRLLRVEKHLGLAKA